MRIDNWSITAFGPIADWSVNKIADHDVVVILGPNESGKSALFEFFKSALFGFAPASADSHPYRPWDGRYPEGRLQVVLRNAASAEVVRYLTSRPSGRLNSAGESHDLRNRSVPWVGLMTRDVFKNVYALTQEEALRLDAQAWQVVQDRVLGGSSYDFLRPSREVVDSLRKERQAHWRPDRRGNPRAKQLTAEIRDLRRNDLREAGGRRRQIENIDDQLQVIEHDLAENSRQLRNVRLMLDRDAILAPLVLRVASMEALEEKAVKLVSSDDLPPELPNRRTQLQSELDGLRDKFSVLTTEIGELKEACDLVEPVSRLLDRREVIERLNRDSSRAAEDQVRIERMDRGLREHEGVRNELCERALAVVHVEKSAEDAICNLSVAELRGRFSAWQQAQRRLEAATDDVDPTEAESFGQGRETATRLNVAGLVFGALLLALGFVVGGPTGTSVAVLGAVCLAALTMVLVSQRSSAARFAAQQQRKQREVSSARADFEAARHQFREVIDGVPVASVHLESPTEGLDRDLESLRHVLTDSRAIREDRDEVAERLGLWRGDVDELRGALLTELPLDPFEAVNAAQRALGVAIERKRDADRAAVQLQESTSNLEECEQAIGAICLNLGEINNQLAVLDPANGDPEAGLGRLVEARDLRDESQRIRDYIELETPDWRNRVAEAERLQSEGLSINLTDEERVDFQQRREELEGRRQELAHEQGSLARERDQLTRSPGPAHIEGAIEAKNEQLRMTKVEHDRLALLERIVVVAEREYRERHQPQLLTIAGRYLQRFTDGRYDLLEVDDVSTREVQLQVRRSGEDFPKKVDEPLSRGTIQQIYFALRLATVDLVEGDSQEPLPLFLDEMFVNWDPLRTISGLEVLSDMPGNRQVFLFTADPNWADRARCEAGAHIVRTPAA